MWWFAQVGRTLLAVVCRKYLRGMVAHELQTSKRLLLVGGTLAGCMLLAIAGFGKAGRKGRPAALLQQRLQHWGGVGSENYHTSKWDDTGSK